MSENLNENAKSAKEVPDEVYFFSDIPDDAKTAKLCMEAVKKWGDNLRYVPEHMKTAKLCMAAVKNNARALGMEEFKGAELRKLLREQKETALKYVPENLKTAKLCKEAVKNDAYAIKYVPEHLKEACLAYEEAL